MRRLRFRYRPSKLGRALAYLIVLVGLAVWLVSGAWHNPAEVGNSRAIPFWTLTLAGGAYFLGAFVEKFGFEDTTPNGD
jgi:uncharacterized RDD family membrane protein YckC